MIKDGLKSESVPPAASAPARQMKVVQFWRSDDTNGGGPIMMNRLHRALRAADVDSTILCMKKNSDSPYVKVIKPWRRTEMWISRVTSRLGLNDIHRISSFTLAKNRYYASADVVHFHGTHSGFISYLALPRLTKDKPTVLTLHDMTAFTGHCSFSFDCEKWRTGCGKCPYPHVNPAIERDATRWEWRLKDWAYSRSKLHIVAPSRWMAQLARESMLGRFPVHWIPNGLDTDVFQPLDSQHCRRLLGIPDGKRVLMFVSVNMRHHRKGGDLLVKAMSSLPERLKSETVLLLLGRGGGEIARSVGIPAIELGYIDNDRIKAIAYSAADVLVHPARADNLPLVIEEAIACGTPVVSFRIGGIPEMVRPGVTGCLAENEDADGLARGIASLLEDEDGRAAMGQQCRKIALDEYTLDLQVRRHLELYRQIAGLPETLVNKSA